MTLPDYSIVPEEGRFSAWKKLKKYEFASVDIETLGLTESAVILSIGAVAFDADTALTEPLDDAQVFKARVDISSAQAAGGTIDASVLAWWAQQSAEARTEAFAFGGDLLVKVLHQFAAWVRGTLQEDYKIVCNDIDFDKQILHGAYERTYMGDASPFKFERGSRRAVSLPTLEWIIRTFCGIPLEYHPPAISHECLSDAIAQARRAQQAFYALREMRNALLDSDNLHSADEFFKSVAADGFATFRDESSVTLGEADDHTDLEESAERGGGEETNQDSVGAP